MANPTSNTIEYKGDTVIIRQENVTLNDKSFLAGYHHLVYATNVSIKKGWVTPGRNVTIYAAHVDVDSTGGRIDVSGANGRDGADGKGPTHANTYKPGAPHDGQDGTNGDTASPGQNGGTITIYAETIAGGPLELVSHGGKGGRGQDGANGKDGATPGDQPDAQVPKWVVIRQYTKTNIYGEDEIHNEMGWDPATAKKIGSDGWGAYVSVGFTAEAGKRGGNGGHAGEAGKSGDGGAGGRIVVRATTPMTAKIATDIGGGAKGALAKHGTPGKAADGGKGGRYEYKASVGFVEIGWSCYDDDSRWDSYWNTKNTTFDHIKNLGVSSDYLVSDGSDRKLKPRADGGGRGSNGGYGSRGDSNQPAIPATKDGASGSASLEPLSRGGTEFPAVPLPYVYMLQRSAVAALYNAEIDRAAELLRWVMVLLAPQRFAPATASAEDQQRRALYREAEHLLMTRDRDEAASGRAAQCVYKDIERYSSFVETLLKHVAGVEKEFSEYDVSQKAIDEQKVKLATAIETLRQQISELDGDASTPGTIAYAKQRELALKGEISRIDLRMMDYPGVFKSMERDLQNTIEKAAQDKLKASLWDMLEYVGMVAGIAINFASAASAAKGLVEKVAAFYKRADKEIMTAKDVLVEAFWKRDFTQVKDDISQLMETDAYKEMTKKTKGFISGAVDFRAKVIAFNDLLAEHERPEFAIDEIDLQATVLVFDAGKLALREQRVDFEDFIADYTDEHDAAKKWKHEFSHYFEAADARFDMLCHIADVQAQRRALESQRNVCQRNRDLLVAQKAKLEFANPTLDVDDLRTGLESSLHVALEYGLERIADESRAFTLYTLDRHPLPKVPANVTAKALRTQFHDPLWTKIQNEVSQRKRPKSKWLPSGFAVWTRDAYPRQFALFAEKCTIMLPLEPIVEGDDFFLRLVDAKVFLHGAATDEGSPVHCVLRHPGVSNFVNRGRQVISCYQEPIGVEIAYVLGDDGKPTYAGFEGAIDDQFDNAVDDIGRIRYSPFTTWQLDVRLPKSGDPTALYNRGLSLASISAIELRLNAIYGNRTVNLSDVGGLPSHSPATQVSA